MGNKFCSNGKSFFTLTLLASIWLVLAFTFSCSSDNGSSSVTDNSSSSGSDGESRDCPNAVTGNNTVSCGGQTYKTVVIKDQTWMAENLNYNASGSKCYNENPDNCTKYGRLYTWASAINVCPSGWHLPSEAEWDKLEASVKDVFGCLISIGKCLKAKNGWYNNGNGTDELGFTALPGGVCWSNGEFLEEGETGYFWGSSDEHEFPWGSEDWGYYRDIGYSSYGNGYNEKTNMFSVRCLKD